MSFSVQNLLQEHLEPEDEVVDYTFISEENFLLVLLLTVKGTAALCDKLTKAV